MSCRCAREPPLILALLTSCAPDASEHAASVGAEPTGPETPMRFEERAAEAGLGDFEQENGSDEKLYIVESVGGGVAWIDCDQDGWLDAYLSNGSSLEGFAPGAEPREALYRNRGDRTFEDVTASSGLVDREWTMGVAAVDADGDGWTDLFLANYGPDVLFWSQGAGRFAAAASGDGPSDPRWSTGACFVDGDRDGDLDLYLANYVEFDADAIRARQFFSEFQGVRVYAGPRGLAAAPDAYFVNEGGRRFRDATAEVGIVDTDGYGLEAVPLDHDEDGWMDVYVANDSTPSALWCNKGGGRFENRALAAGVAFAKSGAAQASMGIAIGDANGDARADLFVTTFSEDYSTLFLGQPAGRFRDASQSCGVAEPTYATLGWSCALVDFEHDGDVDLFQANGHVFPQVDRFSLGTSYLQKNQVLENDGDGRFRDVSERAGPALAVARAHRGAAFGDYDEDGDQDILVGVIDGRPALLENCSRLAGPSIRVALRGTLSPRDPVGAVAELRGGPRRLVRWYAPNSGFLSASDPRLHFGLGDARGPWSLRVRWPSGAVEDVEGLEPGGSYLVIEGSGAAERVEYWPTPLRTTR